MHYTKIRSSIKLIHEAVSTSVTGEVLERMHAEYLFARNEKHTVAVAIIKESDAVYLVTHKENSTAHDIHNVGVETDGVMDCSAV